MIDGKIECNMPYNLSYYNERNKEQYFNNIRVETGSTTNTFGASWGWFHTSQQRNKLHNIQIRGQSASGYLNGETELPAK